MSQVDPEQTSPAFQLAEVAIPRTLFAVILSLIARLLAAVRVGALVRLLGLRRRQPQRAAPGRQSALNSPSAHRWPSWQKL